MCLCFSWGTNIIARSLSTGSKFLHLGSFLQIVVFSRNCQKTYQWVCEGVRKSTDWLCFYFFKIFILCVYGYIRVCVCEHISFLMPSSIKWLDTVPCAVHKQQDQSCIFTLFGNYHAKLNLRPLKRLPVLSSSQPVVTSNLFSVSMKLPILASLFK